MKPNFIKPYSGSTLLYNLNHVYKIEKVHTTVTFYLINGETFQMNSGHILQEIKTLFDLD